MSACFFPAGYAQSWRQDDRAPHRPHQPEATVAAPRPFWPHTSWVFLPTSAPYKKACILFQIVKNWILYNKIPRCQIFFAFRNRSKFCGAFVIVLKNIHKTIKIEIASSASRRTRSDITPSGERHCGSPAHHSFDDGEEVAVRQNTKQSPPSAPNDSDHCTSKQSQKFLNSRGMAALLTAASRWAIIGTRQSTIAVFKRLER